jgi:hypothetical protein
MVAWSTTALTQISLLAGAFLRGCNWQNAGLEFDGTLHELRTKASDDNDADARPVHGRFGS